MRCNPGVLFSRVPSLLFSGNARQYGNPLAIVFRFASSEDFFNDSILRASSAVSCIARFVSVRCALFIFACDESISWFGCGQQLATAATSDYHTLSIDPLNGYTAQTDFSAYDGSDAKVLLDRVVSNTKLTL